jgi:hypothetical protein
VTNRSPARIAPTSISITLFDEQHRHIDWRHMRGALNRRLAGRVKRKPREDETNDLG